MNFTITINGEASDLDTVIRALSEMNGQPKQAILTAAQPQHQEAPVFQQQSPVQQQSFQQLQPHFEQQGQQAPVQQQYQPQPFEQQPVYQQAQPQQGYQPQQQPINSVPVSTVNYDMAQLSVAATQLMDAGRQPELIELLKAFGVAALTMLPKEQYGNFATALRGMGAKI